MVNFFYFHLGVCLGDYKERFEIIKKSKRLAYGIVGLLLLISLFYIAPQNPSPADVNINRFGNKYMFLVFSLIGIMGFLLFSVGIRNGRFVEYLGKNSLTILLFHIPVWRVANMELGNLGINGYWRLILVSIVAMSFSLIAVLIVNKYISQLKGNFKYSNGK